METCTLAEISEDKLMLRQRPFNQEAVTAFFPPSPALVWGRRRLPQGHRTTSYHRHRPIPWPCVLGYLPPAGSHLWGEGRTNRSLVVQGVKQLLEAAGGTDPPSHRRSLGWPHRGARPRQVFPPGVPQRGGGARRRRAGLRPAGPEGSQGEPRDYEKGPGAPTGSEPGEGIVPGVPGVPAASQPSRGRQPGVRREAPSLRPPWGRGRPAPPRTGATWRAGSPTGGRISISLAEETLRSTVNPLRAASQSRARAERRLLASAIPLGKAPRGRAVCQRRR